MGKPAISYASRPDATPQAELSALASVYRYVLCCRAKKETAPADRPDAGKEIDERSGKVIIPK